LRAGTFGGMKTTQSSLSEFFATSRAMINQGYLDSITLYQLDKHTLFVFVAMQVPQVNAKQRA